MQNTVEPVAVPYSPLGRSGAVMEQGGRVSIVDVLRDSLTIFSAHSGAILGAAFLGFALAAVLGSVLSAVFTMAMYGRTGTILASYGPDRNFVLVVEAVTGLLAGTFARGAITWMVLQPNGEGATVRSAARATLSHLPILLFTLLLAGGLIFLGNLGLTALLRELQLDLASAAQLSLGLDAMAHSIFLRILNGFIPDPGAPFTQLLTYLRSETTRVSASLVYAGGLSYYRVVAIDQIPMPLLVVSASALLLVVGDTLLRFVTVGIMCSWNGNTLQTLQSLFSAVRFAGRHFWVVLSYTWLVRLTVFLISSFCMTAPLVLVQGLFVPLMISLTGGPWVYLFASMLVSMSLALVNMIFVAYAVVFDTCLYQQLVRDSA